MELEREYAIAPARTGATTEAAQCLSRCCRIRRSRGVVLARACGWRAMKFPPREAFEQARRLDPDDAEIAHACVALSGTLPEHVESDYIRSFFDEFADHFDHIAGESVLPTACQ